MREVTGDLWTHEPADGWVVPTNGVVVNGKNIMGKGVALQAARRWPDLPPAIGRGLSLGGNHVREFWLGGQGPIFSFPTKHHWRQPSDLDLIRRSAEELVAAVEGGPRPKESPFYKPLENVLLPRVGAGEGRLAWKDVAQVLNAVLDDRFVVVTPEGTP